MRYVMNKTVPFTLHGSKYKCYQDTHSNFVAHLKLTFEDLFANTLFAVEHSELEGAVRGRKSFYTSASCESLGWLISEKLYDTYHHLIECEVTILPTSRIIGVSTINHKYNPNLSELINKTSEELEITAYVTVQSTRHTIKPYPELQKT